MPLFGPLVYNGLSYSDFHTSIPLAWLHPTLCMHCIWGWCMIWCQQCGLWTLIKMIQMARTASPWLRIQKSFRRHGMILICRISMHWVVCQSNISINCASSAIYDIHPSIGNEDEWTFSIFSSKV